MLIFGAVMLVLLGFQFIRSGQKGTFDLGAIITAIYVMITMFR